MLFLKLIYDTHCKDNQILQISIYDSDTGTNKNIDVYPEHEVNRAVLNWYTPTAHGDTISVISEALQRELHMKKVMFFNITEQNLFYTQTRVAVMPSYLVSKFNTIKFTNVGEDIYLDTSALTFKDCCGMLGVEYNTQEFGKCLYHAYEAIQENNLPSSIEHIDSLESLRLFCYSLAAKFSNSDSVGDYKIKKKSFINKRRYHIVVKDIYYKDTLLMQGVINKKGVGSGFQRFIAKEIPEGVC